MPHPHDASKHNTHTFIHKHIGGWQLISKLY